MSGRPTFIGTLIQKMQRGDDLGLRHVLVETPLDEVLNRFHLRPGVGAGLALAGHGFVLLSACGGVRLFRGVRRAAAVFARRRRTVRGSVGALFRLARPVGRFTSRFFWCGRAEGLTVHFANVGRSNPPLRRVCSFQIIWKPGCSNTLGSAH